MEFLLFAAILFLAFSGVFLYFVPLGLWVSAVASGAGVGLFQLVFMRLRRVPPAVIVNSRISAVKAGVDVSVDDLEAHFLAGGNVDKVVSALISADKAGINLKFPRAAAIDLAGRDVLDAVRMSVNPRVIQTPKVAATYVDTSALAVQSASLLRN